MKISIFNLFAFLIILSFSSCKSKLDSPVPNEKITISLDDFQKNIQKISAEKKEKKLKEYVVNKKVNLNKKQVNQLKRNIAKRILNEDNNDFKVKLPELSKPDWCFRDSIFCNDTTFVRSYIKCVDGEGGPITHSVTGEISFGDITAKSALRQGINCGAGGPCINIYKDENGFIDPVYIGLNLAVKIPCDEVDNSPTFDVTMKLFGNKEISINNISGEYNNESPSDTDPSIEYNSNANTFPLNISRHYYECDSQCYVRMSINFHFTPELQEGNVCKPYPHFLALQLENSDLILHKGHKKSHNSVPVNLSFSAIDLLDEGIVNNSSELIAASILEKTILTTNVNSNLFCENNLETLADFVYNDDEVACEHLADHTLVLRVPFCATPTQIIQE